MSDESKNELEFIKSEGLKEKLLSKKWKNRRWMAWGSFANIMVISYLAMFELSDARLAAVQEILIWAFIIFGGIVLAYMGLTTVVEHLSKRK